MPLRNAIERSISPISRMKTTPKASIVVPAIWVMMLLRLTGVKKFCAVRLKTITTIQPTEGHRAMRIAAKNPSEETMRPVIAAFMADPSKLPDEEFQRRIEAAKRQPLRETPMGTSTAPWRDQEPELHRIKAKTLIMWGREDRVNPLEIGLLILREIENSRLYVVRNCGHWVQIEARDEFNRVALEFLAS